MSIIPKQNLVGYWPLDGHALDMSSMSSLNNNLVGYWPLSDTSDSTTNAYNLTNVNATFSAGKIGNAADLGASNSSKYLYVSGNCGITGGAMSMFAWVNVTTAPGTNTQQIIFGQNDATSASYAGFTVWYLDSGGTKYLRGNRGKNGVADQSRDYATTLTTGTWYHCGITYDGTNLRLYLNGVQVGADLACSGNGVAGGSSNVTIGTYYALSGLYFSGLVDELALWNRKLTTDEITALYNAGGGNPYKFKDQYTANNGAVTGALPAPSQNAAIPASLAYKFNGTSDLISVPAPAVPLKNISVCAWAFLNDANDNVVVSLKSAGGVIITLGIWSTVGTANKIAFARWSSSNGNWNVANSPDTTKTGRWLFLCGVNDGTNNLLYVDGVLKATAADTRAGEIPTTIEVGRSGYSPNYAYLDGRAQDISLFSKPLTAQEIQAIYNRSTQKYKQKGWLVNQIAQFFKAMARLGSVLDASYKRILSPVGMVGYWPLDGHTQDINPSTSRTDATATGAVISPAGNQALPVSLSYKFTKASNQYISTATSTGWTGSNYSMTGWVKLSSTPASGGFMTFFEVEETTNKTALMAGYYNNAGTPQLYFVRNKYGVADQGYIANYSLPLNKWFYATITYDGTNVYAYIDGKLIGSGAASGTGNAGGSNFTRIGFGDIGTTPYLDGFVQDVAMYSRALSAQEIQAYYKFAKSSYARKTAVTSILNAIADKLNAIFFGHNF